MSLKATLPEYWCVLLPAGSPFFLKQIRWTKKKKELQSGPGSLLSRTPLREGDNGDVGYGDSSLLFRRCTPQLPIFPSSPGHQAWTTESLMKAHVWSANCRTEVGSCRKNPPQRCRDHPSLRVPSDRLIKNGRPHFWKQGNKRFINTEHR